MYRPSAGNKVKCRICGCNISETEKKCSNCNSYAPGIYSKCPKCFSLNYVFHNYGYSLRRGIGGAIVGGAIGILLGGLGSSDTECICLKCRQGWMPYAWGGGEDSITRKFKAIPKDSY